MITDNLSCCYEFSSSALLLVDCTANNLTLTNSANPVTSVAGGVIGNAGSFTAASTMKLIRASQTLLQPGPDLTVEAWIKPTVVNVTFPGVVTKIGATGNFSYGFYLSNADAAFRVAASDDTQQDATAAASLTAGVFVQLIGTYDSSDKKGRIYVNNGAENVSAVLTAGINTGGNADFAIGSFLDTWWFGGLIDLVRMWKRVITADERTYLYNSGAGRSFLEMVGFPEPINSQMRAGGMVGNINV